MIDLNNLSQTNYKVLIQRLPTVEYKIQTCQLPDISLGPLKAPTPFVPVKVPGNIEYDTFSLTFQVSETLADYLEIFNWMQQIGQPDAGYFPAKFSDAFSDIEVDILSSSLNPLYSANFKDAFPVGLSGLIFDSTITTATYIRAQATFAFTSYSLTSSLT